MPWALAATIPLGEAATASPGAESLIAAVPLVLLFFAAVVAAVGLGALLVKTRRRLSASARERAGFATLSEQLWELLSASPDGYFCWDLLGGGDSCSRRLARMLGLEPDGHHSFDAVQSRFSEADARTLGEAVSALRDRGAEFDLLLTHGGVEGGIARTVRAVGVQAKNRDGEPVAAIVWFRNLSGFVAETARLLGEKEYLAGERNQLRALLDALPIPAWLRDSELTLSYCNRAYARAVETDPATALRENREIARSVIADHGRELAERARVTGMGQSESHHVVVAGERRVLEFTEEPLEGEGVESGETVGYAIDFTDLEKVQMDLSRQIAAHENVLEQLTTAVALFGADQTLRFFNTAYKNLWHHDDSWLRAGPDYGSILEAQREKRRLPEHADFKAFKEAQLRLFSSLIEPHEELLHLPDETTLRMIIVPHPFGGLLFTFDDVSDRLALETSYNTLIAVQRETLDNLYEGVAVFGRDGRLKLHNPAYARLWGISAEGLEKGPHIADIVEAARSYFGVDDDDEWAEMKERMIAEIIETTSRSGRFERSDGSVLEYATMPLPDGNVLLRYVDATDRFRVEQALRERNQALETASRLKSEFIANVSYELRTPLNTIIGFSEILKKEYFGALNSRQKEYSEGILESSQRLLALINNILDLATVEAGYMALELETVDVHDMLVGVLSLTRERARARKLKLELDCPPDIGSLHADPRRLQQAVFNLVSNSIKYTPPGGAITVSARQADGEMRIAVADTGVGVPEEDRERVFEKFVQGPSGRARQSGAGLGLSLVKSFIELHGGRVVLESAPDAGTLVTCYLPIHAAEAEAASAAGTR